MSDEKLAVAPFYISDWMGSEAVAAMNPEEEVLFYRLIIRIWENGSLPTSEDALLRLAGVRESLFERAWPAVKVHFYEVDGRLHNAKTDEKRPKHLEKVLKSREHGKNGAEARWKKKKEMPEQCPSITSYPIARAMPEQCPSNAPSSIIHPPSDVRLYPAIGTVSGIRRKQQGNAKIDHELFHSFKELLAYWGEDAAGKDRLGKLDDETITRIIRTWPGTFDEFGAALKARCLDVRPESIKTWGWFVTTAKTMAETYLADTG